MLKKLALIIIAVFAVVSFCSESAYAQTSVNVTVSESAYTPGQINVPVRATNFSGKQIFAFQGELVYDQNVLQFEKIVSDFTIVFNPSDINRVKFAAYGIYPMTTDGEIMQIVFNSLRSNVQTEVSMGSFMFNEGDPTVSTFPGQITINPESIKLFGEVKFWYSGAPVPDVKLSYADPYENAPRETYTDLEGKYTLELPYGARGRMIAWKSHEDSIVTLKDAGYALGCIVNGWGCNPYIGDVTGDTKISALDANEIARFAVGYRDNLLVGSWIFFPPYTDFYNLTDDYVKNLNAAVKGDLTGNYDTLVSTASVEAFNKVQVNNEGNYLVVDISGHTFQSMHFELIGSVSILSVEAEGFNVVQNGNRVGLYRDSQIHSAHIVIAISVAEATEVKITNVLIDEDISIDELWYGVIGDPPQDPTPAPLIEQPAKPVELKVYLPAIQQGYEDQEEMPILD